MGWFPTSGLGTQVLESIKTTRRGFNEMTETVPFSQRFQRNIRLTRHVNERMEKRQITEAMLFDLIETGDIREKSPTDIWIFKHYPERNDNLLCAAVLLAQAVIVKTVMVDWTLQENEP
jgi:hypothetical protein